MLRELHALLRTGLSLAVACTAGAGYAAARHGFDASGGWAMLGVFLFACAASALNQVQERGVDAHMRRTRGRPLPSGRIPVPSAAVFSILLAVAGVAVLWLHTTHTAALIGCANLILYNAVYTPLKRRSPFALLVGAAVGALPILIGCAAVGKGLDGGAWCLAAFMFLWQVPHFLVLLQIYGDEYREAGLPVLPQSIHPAGLRIIIIAWLSGASVCALCFPLFGLVWGRGWVAVLSGVIVIATGVVVYLNRRDEQDTTHRAVLVGLYAYQGVILAVAVVYAMTSHHP